MVISYQINPTQGLKILCYILLTYSQDRKFSPFAYSRINDEVRFLTYYVQCGDDKLIVYGQAGLSV